jgi:hypothetical protein
MKKRMILGLVLILFVVRKKTEQPLDIAGWRLL